MSRKFYEGFIEELKPDEVFVFGSNPEGRHGAGAAKIALNKFGAKYGVGRGIQGNSYALPTKNLTPNFFEKSSGITYKSYGERSISIEQIIYNIKELYDYATKNPNKKFLIAYQLNGRNLNGYSGEEMFEMFNSVKIPENIVFEKSFEKLFNELNLEVDIER